MTIPPYNEIAAISLLAAPGAAAGLIALGSVFRERRGRARRLLEVRHLNEMLRLNDEVPSPMLRRHYEARLDEAIGGFEIRDYARSPGAEQAVDAYLRRLKEAGGRQ